MVITKRRSNRRSARLSWTGWISIMGLILLSVSLVTPARAQEPTPPAGMNPIPTFAHYYIWFNSNSWDRAKMDYPLLGRYTSDDRTVMRQHIKMAQDAGIDGFLVSWKSTDVLDRRLEQLTEVAEEENFKLAIVYEGLDFNRNPLPVDQIASDMDYFIEHFSQRKPFQIFSKPLVVWSGTWEFSETQISQVTQSRRSALLILASEKNVEDYKRVASLVDGDMYYWSSVNPDTNTRYGDKLNQMSAEIHKNGGLWIAPAAPGFNATLVGGTSNVDRKNGDTFQTEISAAMASSPDILGIISWNEFSENTYIEPSEKYGTLYLDTLKRIDNTPLPNTGSFDSSDDTFSFSELPPASRELALGGFAFIVLAAVVIISRRRTDRIKRGKDE
jgi:hypothetical protein